MPELPEVEVVRRDLEKQITEGLVVKQFVFHRRDIRGPIPGGKIQTLVGVVLRSVLRRAKYLFFETEKGYLVSHLGMSGSWRVEKSSQIERKKHDHVEIHFTNGFCFIFNDPRRFGIFDFAANLENYEKIKNLGPEPWAEEFSARVLQKKFQGTKRSIKVALMDPRTVVGVGNIYASEILFELGLKPLKKSHSLSREELHKLVLVTQKILEKAIEEGGSTIKTFQNTNGKSGVFQNSHQVYGREGKNCYVCQQKIRKIIIAGRSSFWCPRCQK